MESSPTNILGSSGITGIPRALLIGKRLLNSKAQMNESYPPPQKLPEPIISPTPETAESDFQFFKELCSRDPRYGKYDDRRLRNLWNLWYPTCPIDWEAPPQA